MQLSSLSLSLIQETAMAPSTATTSGGFTRLSKGLSLLLFLGHLVTLIFPWTLNYLALIPAKTVPFVWNILTAGYIEQSIFGLILSIVGLLVSARLLEPLWTAREFLKFIMFVNMITLFGVYATSVALYYVTREYRYLYMPLSGFHGVLSGFLVGVKLTMPDHEIKLLGRFHIRAEWLPSILVGTTIILSFCTLEATRYLPFVLFGTYGSWLYLRYLQRKPELNFTGNLGDEFAFSTFFPPFLRPMVDLVASTIHKLLCRSRYPKRDAHSSEDLSEPSFDTAETSRWRERGSRTLAERLEESRDDDARKDHSDIV